MGTPRRWIEPLLCAALALCAGCGGAATSTAPSPGVTGCTFTVTMSSFTSTPSPAQGTRYQFFFASTVLPQTAAVYLVDVNAAPPGCTTAWTAVSRNRDAVQVSPAAGSGRGQVELFIAAGIDPTRALDLRSTDVTIAGEQATITQHSLH